MSSRELLRQINNKSENFESAQIIPSGVWEGHVRWVSGTFNGQPLNHVPEKMRVFLVFDNSGAIYGGGTQRNNYFEVRISGKYNPKTGGDIQWTKVTLQKCTGAMNGCNIYQGIFDNNSVTGKLSISGKITRGDTDWTGIFSISFLGTSGINDEEDLPVHQWIPHPSVTKLTTEVSYHEMLWKDDSKYKTDSSTCPLGISVEDVLEDSDWLDYYCLEVYQGLYYYPSNEHLAKSTKAYEKLMFLALKYAQQNHKLHASFAIDLIWQAHLMHPKKYHEDCFSLIGYELDYHPWSNETEKEDSRIEFTEKLWSKEFEEEIYRKEK